MVGLIYRKNPHQPLSINMIDCPCKSTCIYIIYNSIQFNSYLHKPSYSYVSHNVWEKNWVVYTVYTRIYDTMWLQWNQRGGVEVPNLALQFLFSNFEHKRSRFVNGCKVSIVNFVFGHFVEDYNRNQSNKKNKAPNSF